MDALAGLLKQNLQSLMVQQNEKLQNHSQVILEETYCKIYLKSDSVNDVSKVILRGRHIYYKKYDSARLYKFPMMNFPDFTVPKDIVNEVSFFDSIDVAYDDFSHLKFGNSTIKISEEPVFDRYRVTHHLGKKLFFIGYRSSDVIVFGNLHAADVSNASITEVTGEMIDFKYDISDLCVDQYTGDIVLCTVQSKIFVFQKLRYANGVTNFANTV